MEAVILAGGLGTRLKSVVCDLPKSMAPISGKPFMWYMLEYLNCQRVNRVILATGFKHDCIERYFGNRYKDMAIVYSREDEPLGTGGALKKAFAYLSEDYVVVLNGDTFFDIDLKRAIDIHFLENTDLTLCLKPMKNFSRYGIVITSGNRVIGFEEKKYRKYGNINGGVYIVKTNIFKKIELPIKFSFEIDFIEKYVSKQYFNAYFCDGYFIDIGIPSDYQKANSEICEIFAHKVG